MGKLDELPRFEAKTRQSWRLWLQKNHQSSQGVWLVTFKKDSGKPRLAYDEAVEELLCFGWIDSLPRALDAQRSMLLCTPRKPTSAWSKANRDRVQKLLKAGLMKPRGIELVEQAKRSGAWSKLVGVDALEIPDDLKKRFADHPGSSDNFAAFPPSVKRGILEWIAQAKKPQTRERRMDETAKSAAVNVRANQWRP